jgi:NDP-sugar pyrophosphorylase family protein
VKFVEKPKNRDDISFIVNTGIYLLPRALLPTGGKNVKIEDSFFADFI